MSINVSSFELKVDGVNSNKVLRRYKDADGITYLSNLEDGYYPLDKDRNYISDEEIIKKVSQSFPDKEIFFRIDTDYGEQAYLYKDGKLRELKKEWK